MVGPKGETRATASKDFTGVPTLADVAALRARSTSPVEAALNGTRGSSPGRGSRQSLSPRKSVSPRRTPSPLKPHSSVLAVQLRTPVHSPTAASFLSGKSGASTPDSRMAFSTLSLLPPVPHATRLVRPGQGSPQGRGGLERTMIDDFGTTNRLYASPKKELPHNAHHSVWNPVSTVPPLGVKVQPERVNGPAQNFNDLIRPKSAFLRAEIYSTRATASPK